MGESWEEEYVDQQVGRAWRDFRLALADRVADGLAAADMEPIDIHAGDGRDLSVLVEGDRAVIFTDDVVATSANADELAHRVYEIVHDRWQVLHPVLLGTDLLPAAPVEDAPGGGVPVLGWADSREELQRWVEAAFQEDLDVPLRTDVHGDIRWNTERGEAAVVAVRSDEAVELWTVLARDVASKKARRVIDRLSLEYGGLKFFLRRSTLLMSHTVIAKPFVADQLRLALAEFMEISDQLGWVEDAVLRTGAEELRRLRAERDELRAQVARLSGGS